MSRKDTDKPTWPLTRIRSMNSPELPDWLRVVGAVIEENTGQVVVVAIDVGHDGAELVDMEVGDDFSLQGVKNARRIKLRFTRPK